MQPMEEEKKDERGKKFHQKIKPYVVLQYLLKYTDENNVATATAIAEALDENYKISAERRSVYRDIMEINAVALMLEQDCTLDNALDMLADAPDDELKLVVYDPKQKGFYVRQRQYDLNDIRLLAECVYSAKFVSEGQARRLVNALCGMVSEHQAEHIKHDAFLTDRVKTNNRSVLNSIDTINQAMSRRLNGQPHKPEKVRFKYMTYSIKDMHQQLERRHGGDYIVSPFALVINDGNYYLLAYDEKKKDMRTYRLDRMKEVGLTGVPREGEDVFAKLDMNTYCQRRFGMHSGTQRVVTVRFIPPLLDTAVERFGTKDAMYYKPDDRHYAVRANVQISDQFFGWLLGFGKRMKIIDPPEVVEQFKSYLDKVRGMYE